MSGSTYKSEKRWNEASPENKIMSILQRKNNHLKKQLNILTVNNQLKKIQLSNFSRLMDYLIQNHQVTKEEIKLFLTRKKDDLIKLKEKAVPNINPLQELWDSNLKIKRTSQQIKDDMRKEWNKNEK